MPLPATRTVQAPGVGVRQRHDAARLELVIVDRLDRWRGARRLTGRTISTTWRHCSETENIALSMVESMGIENSCTPSASVPAARKTVSSCFIAPIMSTDDSADFGGIEEEHLSAAALGDGEIARIGLSDARPSRATARLLILGGGDCRRRHEGENHEGSKECCMWLPELKLGPTYYTMLSVRCLRPDHTHRT